MCEISRRMENIPRSTICMKIDFEFRFVREKNPSDGRASSTVVI